MCATFLKVLFNDWENCNYVVQLSPKATVHIVAVLDCIIYEGVLVVLFSTL